MLFALTGTDTHGENRAIQFHALDRSDAEQKCGQIAKDNDLYVFRLTLVYDCTKETQYALLGVC